MTRRSWCCRFQGAPLGVRSGTVLGDPCDVDERRRQNKPQAPKSGGRSRRYKARIWTQEHTCVQHKSTVSWCAVSRGPKPMRPTGDQDCQIRLRRITKCEVRRRSFKSGIRQLMSGRPRPADFGLPPPPARIQIRPMRPNGGCPDGGNTGGVDAGMLPATMVTASCHALAPKCKTSAAAAGSGLRLAPKNLRRLKCGLGRKHAPRDWPGDARKT